jgi:nucleotide-binding universal stress UspA family protein
MTTFKRILFPVDFSDQSRAAVPSVKAMASRFDAQTVVMHVMDLPFIWFGLPEAVSCSTLINADQLRASSRVALDLFIKNEFSGTRVSWELAEGDTAVQIVDYAQHDPATLIMMPTHGYGPFRELLLGSITAKVLHDTHCPVWTAVHAQEIAAHSPERWKQMLCSVDTDDRDLAVLQWAAEFACGQRAELKVVHAIPGTNAPVAEENAPRTYKFLFDAARQQLANMQARAGTKLEVCLLGGQAGDVVRRTAIAYDTDLILIGRGVMQEAFGRLRTRAYAIIREAPCPVVSI